MGRRRGLTISKKDRRKADYEKNKERYIREATKWNVDNKDKRWVTRLKSIYNMTPDHYYLMFEGQMGLCAICLQPPKENKRFHIDHDHNCCGSEKSCGKCIRGLLCANCNWMLGLVNDSPKILENAKEYIIYGPFGAKHK